MSFVKPVADTPTLQQQKLLLERILSSVLFRKSYKLATFLKFICEQQQMGHADIINEQRIGTEVFGRSEGYHMGEDSIVRSQARFLRLRLQEYFANEGKDEPVVLTIPKGSYVPDFHFREIQPEPVTASANSSGVHNPSIAGGTSSASEWWKSKRWIWAMAVGVAITVGAVVVAGVGLRRSNNVSNKIPPNQRFWTSIFDPGRTTIIVPADSSLVLMDELSGNEIGLDDYMSHRYRNIPSPPNLAQVWEVLTSSQYTNVVDLNLVSELTRMPEAARGKVQTRYARDVSVSELKQNNVVLIGSARANPWVDLFQSSGHYRVAYDAKTHHNLVYDRDPGPGEQERYEEIGDGPKHLAYGVVAYLPSLDHTGSALLVGGTSKAGTESAAEFLTSTQFSNFLRSIDTGGAISHFEILLSTENLNGNSYQGTIVNFHRLPENH